MLRLSGQSLARFPTAALSRTPMHLMLRLICISLLAGTVVQAQTPSPDRAPLSFGLALGPNGGGKGHISASVTVQRSRLVGQTRLSGNDLDRVVATSIFGSARDSATELALLGGYAQPVAGRWQVTGLIGVSAVRTFRHESRCADTFLGCVPVNGGREVSAVLIGLPVEIGFHGPLVGVLGIGVRVFTTVNSDESYGGASVDLRFNPARGSRR